MCVCLHVFLLLKLFCVCAEDEVSVVLYECPQVITVTYKSSNRMCNSKMELLKPLLENVKANPNAVDVDI